MWSKRWSPDFQMEFRCGAAGAFMFGVPPALKAMLIENRVVGRFEN